MIEHARNTSIRSGWRCSTWDEVRTGMYRTGTFLAAHQFDVQPDMVVLVMRLFRERNILTQICGNNFMVLKVAPPLMVGEE